MIKLMHFDKSRPGWGCTNINDQTWEKHGGLSETLSKDVCCVIPQQNKYPCRFEDFKFIGFPLQIVIV